MIVTNLSLYKDKIYSYLYLHQERAIKEFITSYKKKWLYSYSKDSHFKMLPNHS